MEAQCTYEELKGRILVIKTPEEFNEKAVDLKYKIYSTYYNYSISKDERNILIDLLYLKLCQVFGVID